MFDMYYVVVKKMINLFPNIQLFRKKLDHKIEMRLLKNLNDGTIFQQDKLIQLHFFLVL